MQLCFIFTEWFSNRNGFKNGDNGNDYDGRAKILTNFSKVKCLIVKLDEEWRGLEGWHTWRDVTYVCIVAQ